MSMCAVRVVLLANFSVTVHTPFALNVNGSAPLPALVHLDALVDKAYGLSPSCTDLDRVAHLFKLYAEKTAK